MMAKINPSIFPITLCTTILMICLILFPSPALSKQKKDHHDKGQEPTTTGHNKAILTVNSFEKGGDGGGAAECDGKFHSNKKLIVALSTPWYAQGKRCGKEIIIFANGKKVKATVVDECDTRRGCKHNIVDASEAVWKAIGKPSSIGELPVTWSDA